MFDTIRIFKYEEDSTIAPRKEVATLGLRPRLEFGEPLLQVSPEGGNVRLHVRPSRLLRDGCRNACVRRGVNVMHSCQRLLDVLAPLLQLPGECLSQVSDACGRSHAR